MHHTSIYRLDQHQWDQMLLTVPPLNARDQHVFEAVLHVLSTALPWTELPEEEFGITSRTCWNRHKHWTHQGLWDSILEAFYSTLSSDEQHHWQQQMGWALQHRSQKFGKSKRPVLVEASG